MNNKITTLDHVRPSDFNGIKEATQVAQINLSTRRADILKRLETFAWETGPEAAINAVTNLVSRYLYACSFIEALSHNTAMQATDELKEIVEDAANYLPSFRDLSDAAYIVKGLFVFLLSVDSDLDIAKKSEHELQLIEHIAGAASRKA